MSRSLLIRAEINRLAGRQLPKAPWMSSRLTNWHRADVVAEVHKLGSNLAELARQNGRSESCLRVALTHPRSPSNRIIASFLGKAPHEIWPEWFNKKGMLRSREPSRTRRGGSTQNG